MNSEALLARRNAVAERHRTLESVSGSGWHEDDPTQRELRKEGYVILSKRPVAIQVDDYVYFVGPDIDFIRSKVAEFVAMADGRSVDDSLALRHQHLQAEKQCRRIMGRPVSDVLELSSIEFNSVTYGLAEVMGIMIVVTGTQ